MGRARSYVAIRLFRQGDGWCWQVGAACGPDEFKPKRSGTERTHHEARRAARMARRELMEADKGWLRHFAELLGEAGEKLRKHWAYEGPQKPRATDAEERP